MDVDHDNPISEDLPAEPETDDYDDVEGHGLREVAIGVSAAAIIGGGASAALAGSPASFHPGNTVHHAVAQAESHIGHVPRGVEQTPDAGRPTDLGAGASAVSEAKSIEANAVHATQSASKTRVERTVDSAERVESFGKQIAKGETTVVQHDVKTATKLLRHITR